MVPENDAIQLSEKLANAAERVARDYFAEDIVSEESFSDQLCGRLKEALTNFESGTLIWHAEVEKSGFVKGRLKARTLSKRSEEPTFGADLVMVIDVDSSTAEMQKGFLAQAKRLEPGKKLKTKLYKELVEQCERMLAFTSASYVFLYHTTGIRIVSAASVVASKSQMLWAIPSWPLNVLFYDFAICYLGDAGIRATDRRSLANLRALTDTEAAIQLVGRDKVKF